MQQNDGVSGSRGSLSPRPTALEPHTFHADPPRGGWVLRTPRPNLTADRYLSDGQISVRDIVTSRRIPIQAGLGLALDASSLFGWAF